MHKCYSCSHDAVKAIADTPYVECGNCLLWAQYPLPPKVYQTPDEYDLAEMPARDVEINLQLARALFDMVGPLSDRDGDEIRARTPKTIDIGCKRPIMANELGRLGCNAWAIDGVEPEKMKHVQTRAQDFEKLRITPLANDPMRDFDLITLIHVFEHFYDPVAALGKLRLMLRDDGRLFIRLPDSRVDGYQQHLSAHHFKIHPYFHNVQSILELCAQRGNAFEVESYRPVGGAGQSDIVLRPIARRPTIAACMIARQEERDLPRALESIRPFADYLTVLDTGSTDRTPVIASSTLVVPTVVAEYLGASEFDEEAKRWRLLDFSKARNESLIRAEATGADWIFWLDADDEILTPSAIRRLVYWREFDAHQAWMLDGQLSWVHIRLWRASKRVRFAGRVHEYPVIDDCRLRSLTNSTVNGNAVKDGDPMIRHHAAPADGQENSNPRNLRILLRMWEDAPDPRTAFYIADTYRGSAAEGARDKAIEWYATRNAMSGGFEHERGFSMLYRARLLRAAGRHDEADSQSSAGLERFPDWQEFVMELADGAYQRQDYDRCIDLCMRAEGKPIPVTPLWREPQMYTDQPWRMASWCYEHMGNIVQALLNSEQATIAIGKPDDEWAFRERRLRAMLEPSQEAPAIHRNARMQIALHRPGAIGDVLMTLNLVPLLREQYGAECDVHYFCSAGIGQMTALGPTILAAGCDAVLDCAGLSAWARRYDRIINLVGYPLAEGHPQERPGKSVMRQHLIAYFAEEMGLALSREGGGIGGGPLLIPSLMLEAPQRPVETIIEGDYATVQIAAGWSRFKEWPGKNWVAVYAALGEAGVPIIVMHEGRTPTLAAAVAMVANARMHLGIDSFAQHLTNYYWTNGPRARKVPGVIVWGSTQPDALGYDHNVNLWARPECGPCWRETAEWSRMAKEPCPNIAPSGVHACMDAITPQMVIDAALRVWEESK